MPGERRGAGVQTRAALRGASAPRRTDPATHPETPRHRPVAAGRAQVRQREFNPDDSQWGLRTPGPSRPRRGDPRGFSVKVLGQAQGGLTRLRRTAGGGPEERLAATRRVGPRPPAAARPPPPSTGEGGGGVRSHRRHPGRSWASRPRRPPHRRDAARPRCPPAFCRGWGGVGRGITLCRLCCC